MESKGNSALAKDLRSDELKNCRSNRKKRLLSLSNPCGPMEQLNISTNIAYSPSLRTADAFPVVASLPPKNSVCEPERQNDFRDVKPF